MNPKIERVDKDIEKTKGKISEFQSRLRELEKQKTELENMEIVALVRGIEIAPQELALFIRAFRENGKAPVELETHTTYIDQEDMEDEE